jgi:hypothetical protein
MNQFKKAFLTSAIILATGGAQAATNLSFEDLKVACQDPSRFHGQIAPKNIEISCQETQYRWAPDKAGTVSLGTERQITSAVVSDKYSVAPTTAEVNMADEVASCPQFVRVKEELSLNRALTCDEVVAFAGTGADFCANLLTEMRAANAKAVHTTILEEERMSTCGQLQDSRIETRSQRGQYDSRSQRGQRR